MTDLLTQTATPVALRVPDFKRVSLTLVGCGGTGSHIASGLVALEQALRAKGIPVDLLFIDPDHVEPKNVGRQLFSLSDVGQPKAEVLAGRLNAAFGLRIMSAVRNLDPLDILTDPADRNTLHIVIGAVDNPAARAVIADGVKSTHNGDSGISARGRLWWIDCGNENNSGQVLLGNATYKTSFRKSISLGLIDRLPAPSLVYPDLIATPKVKRATRTKRAPSCAELTASGEQSLMINRLAAAYALSMLNDFLVTRDLKYFGLAFDQQWGGTRAYTLDAPTLAEVCGLREAELMVTR